MMNLAVVIRKLNETSIQIESEDFDFILFLREKFSFLMDNFRFHPLVKAKKWDGRIYLMNVNGVMPLGLYNQVIRACEQQSKQFFLDPAISVLELQEDRLESFIDSLKIHSGGNTITPYEYQVEAAHHALEQQRCILLSPTSSGKSLIIYIMIRSYLKMFPNERVLIMVPNVGLITQLHADFKDYSSEIDWNPDDYITKMAGGKLDQDKQIVLTTYQSMSNTKTKPDDEFFQEFKVIITDEVHTAAAKSLKDIINKSINAPVRIGLTGTLSESKSNELTLVGLFGDVKEVITTKELMDSDRVAELEIKCQVIKYPEMRCKFMRSAVRGVDDAGKPAKRKANYPEEIDLITADVIRNNYITDFVGGLQGNTIVMIHRIGHGETLHNILTDKYPDRKVYLYNGSIDKEQREEIRQAMELEDGSIIVGSIGTISTGISIKRLNHLVLAHPTKSKIKVLQSVGRLLRKSNFDNKVKFHDIVDDYSIGAYENYSLCHGRERIAYYNNQQFNISTEYITLGDNNDNNTRNP